MSQSGGDDDGGRLPGRRLVRTPSVDRDAFATTERAPVPGKSTLAQRLPFAHPAAAATRAVSAAHGAAARIEVWTPALVDRIAAADYVESGRLSFEIRSSLRRAVRELDELERDDPRHAAAIAGQIVAARDRLATLECELALLLRAAPVIEAPGAGSEDAERSWGAARRASGGPSWDDDAAAIAPRLGLGTVDVRSDDVARDVTDAKHARGVAVGATIYLHPDRIRPGTDDGRHVLAHELVHLAQARLPAARDAGRAAAESEAAELARQIAGGGSITVPRRFIDLSRAAADEDAKQPTVAVEPAEPSLPAGVDYQVVDGEDAVLADRAWLTGSARGVAFRAGRMAAIVRALRDRGRLAWADSRDLAAFAAVPARISKQETTKVVRVDLAAAAYFAIGLPPGVSAIASTRGDGLEITTRLPGIPATAKVHTLDEDGKQELVVALESATGIGMSQRGIAHIKALDIRLTVRNGAIWIALSGATCRALFDVEQWEAWRARGRAAASGPGVVAAGDRAAAIPERMSPEQREWLERWLADHLPRRGAGGGADYLMYVAAREIEAAGPDRDAILARLRGLDGDRAVDHAALRRAIDEGRFDASRARNGLAAQPAGSRETPPVFAYPVPARLAPPRRLIIDGESVALEIAIDWPTENLNTLDQLARRERNPFRAEVEWVFERIDRPGQREIVRPRSPDDPQVLHHAFRLDAGESAATWSVVAFVRSTYFHPASVATQIEVKTETARLADLRRDAMGDLGGDQLATASHDFDIGLIDDKISPSRDDHGHRLVGKLPAGYRAPTDAERETGRKREREHLEALLRYLRRLDHPSPDVVTAVRRSIARLDDVERALAKDRDAGWRSFQVRGTYLSRDADFASGPLDLYGSVKTATRFGALAVSGIVVQLRDLSRRFENAAPAYEGFASTFEAAFEEAFVDLCKAYPAGKVSVLAEELSPDGAQRTGKTIGFELGTSSRLERVKQAVWDPAVSLLVNMAAVVVMAFAPYTAPVIFPSLVAYNTVKTIDDLRDLSSRGLLTGDTIKMSMLSIGLDVLPLAARAKPIASRGWLRYAVEIGDHAGQVAIMTHEARALAIALQDQDIAALADAYRDLIELERTSHPSDPRIAERRKAIEERARQVGKRGYQAWLQVAGNGGLFMISAHQFQTVARAAAAGGGHGADPFAGAGRPLAEHDPAGPTASRREAASEAAGIVHRRPLSSEQREVIADHVPDRPGDYIGETIDRSFQTDEQVDVARWQTKALEDVATEPAPRTPNERGQSEHVRQWLAEPDFRRWYDVWMSMPDRVVVRDDGTAEARVPEGAPPEIAARLRAITANGNVGLMTRALDLTRRIQAAFPGLDPDPASASWRAARPRLVEMLGEVQVRKYEIERTRGESAEERAAIGKRHDKLVDDGELEKLAALLPGMQVYVTGSAAQSAKESKSVGDLDLIVVVPRSMPHAARVELEQRLAGMTVLRANKQGRLPIDPKVMTEEQFLGAAMLETPAGRTPLVNQRIDVGSPSIPGTGTSGGDLHNHVMGVTGTDYFVDKVGDGNAAVALERLARDLDDPSLWKDPGKPPVTPDVHAQIRAGLADIERARDLGMPAEVLEARARRALDGVLTANTRTPFDATYDVRDLLVSRHVDSPDGPFENYARDVIAALHDQGVTYSEQSVSASKLKKRFTPEAMVAAHRRARAEGKDSEMAFLLMVPTSQTLSATTAPDPKVDIETRSLLMRDDVKGIDVAGPESGRFTDHGMAWLVDRYNQLADVARAKGERLVLRPHVGEGYDPNRTGDHVEVARANLAMLVETLDALGYDGTGPVVVRLGHATHATPEILQKLARMGVIVESNIGSNLATGSVLRADDHPLLANMYFGVKTVLATDAQGVMATTLAAEYHRAAHLIARFRAGAPLIVDGKPRYFDSLDPSQQARFSIAWLERQLVDYHTHADQSLAHTSPEKAR